MIITASVRLGLALLATGTLYVATMPRSITFEDAGLFHQVCHLQGIAHPPGYPLFTSICSSLYSLGFDPIMTGNLISIVFALLTLFLLYLALRQLGISSLASSFAVFAFGSSLAFWSQAIIVEVYSLNSLLAAALLLLTLKTCEHSSPFRITCLSFVSGLALTNHWPLILASGPGLFLMLLFHQDTILNQLKKPPTLAATAGAFLLGLSPYLSMFFKPDDVFGYSGQIKTLDELLSYVSRQSYAAVDQSSFATIDDKLQFTGWFFAETVKQTHWLIGLISLYGLSVGLRQSPKTNLALICIFLGNSLLLILLLGFEYSYPYITAFSHYPLIAYLCCFIWTAYGVDKMIHAGRHLSRSTSFAFAATLAAAVIIGVYSNYRINDRRYDHLAQDYATTLFMALPENAVLVTDADASGGTLGYMQRVQKLRTDITLYEADNAFSEHKLYGEDALKRIYLLDLTDKRPVYGIEIHWLPTTTEHGLFQEAGNSGRIGYASRPVLLPFINDITRRYQSSEYKNRFNRGFVHQTLIGVGQYLVGRMQSGSATPDEVATLLSVQRTFPGALGVVSAMLNRGLSEHRELLLELLLAHGDKIPESATPAEIAQYYYLLAALHPGDTRATEYLRLSYEAMPDSRSPVCQLEMGFATGC